MPMHMNSTACFITAAVMIYAASCTAPAPATQFARSYASFANRAIEQALDRPQPTKPSQDKSASAVYIANNYGWELLAEDLRTRGIDRRELLRRVRDTHEKELTRHGLAVEGTTEDPDGAFELRYRGAGRKGIVRGIAREAEGNVHVNLELDEEPETE
jgi:hypothetical protein